MQSSPTTRKVCVVSARKSIHRNSSTPEPLTATNLNRSDVDSATDDEEKEITMAKSSINNSSYNDCSNPTLYDGTGIEKHKNIQQRKSRNTTINSSYNDRSNSSPLKDSKTDQSRNYGNTSKNMSQSKSNLYNHNANNQGTSKWFHASMVVVVVAVTSMGIIAYGNFTTAPSAEKHCSYTKLSDQYPEQQENLWLSLTVGIENILNERSDKPCVFLFLHQGGKRMHSLVQEIAAQASHCFGGPTQLVKMQEDHFTSKQTKLDYGLAIEEYKLRVKQGHVVLIANLNKIPAETAPALHTICDIHNPIAKDVIIILTLEAPTTKGKPTEIATDVLYKLWEHSLSRNELDPLITRVTDQVITFHS